MSSFWHVSSYISIQKNKILQMYGVSRFYIILQKMSQYAAMIPFSVGTESHLLCDCL